jgi:hypothetical protein
MHYNIALEQYIDGKWVQFGLLADPFESMADAEQTLEKLSQLFELRQSRFTFRLDGDKLISINMDQGPVEALIVPENEMMDYLGID